MKFCYCRFRFVKTNPQHLIAKKLGVLECHLASVGCCYLILGVFFLPQHIIFISRIMKSC